MAEVERIIGLRLPLGTTLVRARFQPGFSAKALAVVDMNRSDLNRLLASDGFRHSTSTTERLLTNASLPRALGPRPEWQPDLQRHPIAATYWPPHSTKFRLFQTEQGETTRVRVYLSYSE